MVLYLKVIWGEGAEYSCARLRDLIKAFERSRDVQRR